MNSFLDNLNTREKNLIFAALFLVIIAILFISIRSTVEKQLEKAKSDYEYVVAKAELLSNTTISKSSNTEEIESFIDNLFPESISDLVIVKKDSSLIVSFKTNNLKESISISDEIAFKLGRELNNISYSKNEQDSLTKLVFN
jgi:hypothetical protein